MNQSEIIEIAAAFLSENEIGFVNSGAIGRNTTNKMEVIFPVPETLDPDVIVDPPDVRVWVDTNNGSAELIYQM